MDSTDAATVELRKSTSWRIRFPSLRRSRSLPENYSPPNNSGSSEDSVLGILLADYDNENYKMDHRNRGIAIVINVMHFKNDEEKFREGSLKDADRLKKVLSELKFEVIEPKDAKKKTIYNEIRRVSEMDHSQNDCLMLFVMTHGEKNGRLEASDDTFSIEKLWENFMGDNCKSLTGKPKLFFIQACRGSKYDKGAKLFGCDVVDAKSSSNNLVSLPSSADQLIMYATPEGFVSIRNTIEGSWLIQELCDQLEANYTDDLMSILTTVSRKVAIREIQTPVRKSSKGTKQMPIVVSSLTKKIYFHSTPDDDDTFFSLDTVTSNYRLPKDIY